MPELLICPRHEVPRDFAIQIRSYARIQWPGVFEQPTQVWDFTPRTDGPVHFILHENELVISHVCVNHRRVEFQGENLNVYGLSTVFTYPAHRKAGHSRRLVRAATDHILNRDADLAMLFCGQPLRHFYTSRGWTAMDTARVYYGDKQNPKLKDDNLIMMLFVSDAGRRAGKALETQSIYVGPDTW
jgi:GNAT superfamily N-acetyltransferase